MIDFKAIQAQEKYQPIRVLPLADRIIIMPITHKGTDLRSALKGAPLTQLKSGLFVLNPPDDRILGVVVALGPEIDLEDTSSPCIGDVVYYNKHAGSPITISGREYQAMRKRDALVKVVVGGLSMVENRVLVEPDEPLIQTIGGIIIPDEFVEIPTTGTVRAVGKNFHEGSPFNKGILGMRIMYHKYGGNEVLFIDEKQRKHNLLAIVEPEIMAIIED